MITHNPALLNVINSAKAVAKPPPKMTVSEWADANRFLSAESSASPGRWRTSVVPYAKEIMDAFSDPLVETVVVMSSAQIGKTEIINNVIGETMDHDPSPMLLLQPTLEMAEAYSKDRLAPMIRDTPCLKTRVKDSRSRDSGNTLLHKTFPGGHITMAGANSPSSLASRPIRKVLCDEVDRYPISAGTEGDPVNLARKRTSTFWNRKVGMFSTPTIKGASRIERAYEDSDQRKYYVKCPHCNEAQVLSWQYVKFDNEDASTARYECSECAEAIHDSHKHKMLLSGEWRATAIAKVKGTVGFHLNELYSPWRKFSDTVTDFLQAYRQVKTNPELMKTFKNTALGESFEEIGDKPEIENLMARCEPYEMLTVPLAGIMLTMGVDVQDDRIAIVIRAWGRGEESWLVWHGEIYGSPGLPEVWEQLDELRTRTYTRVDGKEMSIFMTAVDTGGHHTQDVYMYVRARKGSVIAIKGASVSDKQIISKPSLQDIDFKGRTIKKGVQLYVIGVHQAKGVIYNRLKLTGEGQNRFHWPNGTEEEYFKQLTAEILTTEVVKGFPRKVWKLPKGVRNEAFDCEVYAYAAAILAGLQRRKEFKMYNGKVTKAVDNTEIEKVDSESTTAEIDVNEEVKPAPEKPKVQIRRPTRSKSSFVKRR